jgi:hypothetical protein
LASSEGPQPGLARRRRDDERYHRADQHHALDAEIEYAGLFGHQFTERGENQRRATREGQCDEGRDMFGGV